MAPQEPDTPSLSATDEDSMTSSVGDDSVNILVELVGASNLVAEQDDAVEDLKPYCVVKFGGCQIHKTKKVDGPSPIWTVDHNSLFVLSATSHELTQHGLSIQLWTSRDALPNIISSEKIFLGQVHLESTSILANCNGERFELELQDELGEDEGLRGTLALRLRMATASDLKFVKSWSHRQTESTEAAVKALVQDEEHSSRPLVSLTTETDEAQVAGESFINAVSSVFMAASSIQKTGQQGKVRVKPEADPKRPTETQYMTPHEISVETRKPSRSFIQAGSGDLGRVFVEILSCHDLPNTDVGGVVGNVTDSFVTAVFEDAVVQTPVIDDELSPHWLPWTQRAFCFGIMHPASMLYLGVHDYDLGGPLSHHEAIGRVAVNLSNLQRNTQYTLRYALYPSSNVTDRTASGVITIRLYIDIFDEREALMAALKPRPKIHVNVKNPKSFAVVRYTCFGEHDGEETFDLTVMKSYVNEIMTYKCMITYAIGDAIQSLIFWRGQVEVCSVWLPLYSLVFFCSAVTLIERPYMAPAFFLLFLAGIMMANMRHRMTHPSPWNRCPSLYHYLHVLATGQSNMAFNRIEAREGAEKAQKFEDAWNKRMQADMNRAEKKAKLQQELNEAGDDTIQTAPVTVGIPIELLDRLSRYQGIVGKICRMFRFCNIILTWEESILSFWITAVLLGAGLISLLLPWRFILSWTSRLVVYGAFGPHMKVVDLFLHASDNDDFQNVVDKIKSKHQVARIRREDAMKLKAVKCLRFGKFITQVPAFNLARHYDRPLPESTAKFTHKRPTVEPNSPWLPGQQLYGSMIPRPQVASKRNEDLCEKERARIIALEARMNVLKAAVRLGGGFKRTNRLLQLRNQVVQQEEEEMPEAVGYELVQWGGKSFADFVPTKMEWCTPQLPIAAFDFEGLNLCVVPYQDTEETVTTKNKGTPSVVMLVTENTDHPHVDDSVVKPEDGKIPEFNGHDSEYEEEGVEIVAWGRFDVAMDADNVVKDKAQENDELKHEHLPAFEKDAGSHTNLSILYKASDSTFVAYYRP